MWTKWPESEIHDFLARQERKRKSPLRPLVYGVIWGSLFTFIYGLGYRGGLSRGVIIYDSHSRFDTRLLVLGIFATVVIAAIVYYRQWRRIKFFDVDSDALLCTACFEPSAPNAANACECGGELAPYEFYEWNEPKGFEAEARA